MGAPPFDEPTVAQRDEVMMMAVCGIPQETIAKIMRISAEYPHQVLPARARSSAWSNATPRSPAASSEGDLRYAPGAVTAAIFWLKVRNGWKEPPVTIDQTLQILDKRASGDDQ